MFKHSVVLWSFSVGSLPKVTLFTPHTTHLRNYAALRTSISITRLTGLIQYITYSILTFLEFENIPEQWPHLHFEAEWKVSSGLRCCGKLPSKTGCGQSWRTVRALGCWLSHLSWLSQQDVTAALSPLPADHWAWHPLHSPVLSPPPPYLYPRLTLTSKSLQQEWSSTPWCQSGEM